VIPGGLVRRGQVRRQLIELECPESAVLLHPGRGVTHRCGDERGPPRATLALYACEAGTLEHAHVLGDGRERHREARGELADRAIAVRQARDDRAPRRIGQRGESGVERGMTVNHVVYYR